MVRLTLVPVIPLALSYAIKTAGLATSSSFCGVALTLPRKSTPNRETVSYPSMVMHHL